VADEQKRSPILFDASGPPDEADFLEHLGHEVLVCHGPDAGTLCPILSGDGCPTAEEAHGVVFELDLDRPQHRAILLKYKESLREDVPIWVVVRPDQATSHPELLSGLKVLNHRPSLGELDGLAAEVEASDLE